MQIRKSTSADLEQILVLYAQARQFMQENGNPTQWGSKYPPQEQVEQDIATGRSYVCEEDGELLCVFYFAVEEDPDYQKIYEGSWLTDGPYGVMHRVAAPGKRRGVASFCVAWCFETSGGDLRIDTHHDNIPMQRMLEKNGFVQCGTIYTANHSPRIAYEKIRETAARE
ncbi:MAG: GNAT family protein [Lachnospiraceae bacterium]|nr:GNAT family protein [Lachnospiraceae bacterium]